MELQYIVLIGFSYNLIFNFVNVDLFIYLYTLFTYASSVGE